MKRIDEIFGHADYSEKAIEQYLVQQVRKRDGIALKFSSEVQIGYPDRLCLLPGGVTFWVEVKSRGRKPRPIQLQAFTNLTLLGQTVYVADNKKQIDDIIKRHAYKKPSSPVSE